MYQRLENTNKLPSDEYLTDDELLELHNNLIDQANQLLENAQNAMAELTENQEMDPDELDVAISATNRDLSLRFADRERKMLKKSQRFWIGSKRVNTEPATNVKAISVARLRFRPVAVYASTMSGARTSRHN